MKLNKSFLAVELLEGLIGDWVIQVGASHGQSVGGYPAPGDQSALGATTAND